MKKKILGLFSVLLLLFPFVSRADGGGNWQEDTFIYGVALSNDQINSVATTLGIDRSKVKEAPVTGKDLDKYLNNNGTPDGNMISSVLVKKLPKGSGISVNIKTKDKITLITEAQYTNAAITAGVNDLEIDVASPLVVTGESALTGVYKAIELNGGKVDQERTETAQEELATLTKISEDNKDDSAFDEKKLNEAVVQVKQDLQKNKEDTGQTATLEEIKGYLDDALAGVNMENVLSDNNIQILINYFNNYQNTSAIDSKEVKEQLKQFANQLQTGAQKIYEDNKSTIDNMAKEAEESGLWDQIVAFFQSLRASIVGFFNK